MARTWTLTLCCFLACCGAAEAPPADAGPDRFADAAELDGPLADADNAADAAPDRAPPFCTPALLDGGWRADGCAPPLAPQRDLLDEALGEIGLDRCNAGFLDSIAQTFPREVARDRFRLPFFDAMHHRAVGAPRLAHTLTEQLDAAATTARPVSAALAVAAHYAGCGGEVCQGAPPTASGHPLADALARLIAGRGGTADAAQLRQQAATVPQALQQALAPIIDAIGEAARTRDAALRDADLGDPAIPLDALFAHAASLTIFNKSGKELPADQPWVQNLLAGGPRGFDYCALYRGAIQLAAAVEEADLARFAGVEASLAVDTPVGRVLIRGAAADTYEPQDSAIGAEIALLVDTGGDDVYRIPAGATASVENPVSVLVDLGGRDRYGYNEAPSPLDGPRLPSDADGRFAPGTSSQYGPISLSGVSRQGAGRLGVGLLFDLGDASDEYASLRMSQGFGALGVGVLHDAGGDDTYAAENGAQGAGVFGLGLLLDRAGDDIYRTYHQSQGFAYVKAVGVLYDAAGRDAYLADVGDPAQGGDPLYYSPQRPGTGNSSFVQGAGFGRRASSDGVHMSGGLGVLRDRQGDDRYTASVFGQGTGYWFGAGILADGGGHDQYDGLWYVQGSAAHFALAVLRDAAGDDLYNPTLNPAATSIGVGHDFSLGWLIDLGGDDAFRAPGLSLGSGNDNGIGVLINAGGRDRYETKGKRTLGGAPLAAASAGTGRAQLLTVGVFVDTAEADEYVIGGETVPRDDTTWRYESANTDAVTQELGVGLDGSGSANP